MQRLRYLWQATLGDAQVSYCEDHIGPFVSTDFPDGTSVIARPDSDTTWDWRHDVLHSMLAAHLGWDVSPTLWRIAHPDHDDVASDELVAYEEAAVLHIQELLPPLVPN